ncbi:IscS subfamily cysteine desulfurase [Halalkalibacter urbisdiaboli]|uniref:IscS subfamily cysteine desulfurase n=1 Tax=Halalkalibacter urbisdiaboli TaxID=1960589 RepID=UPI000B442659|nr:IscS subfamily cysteine desulfurase [Halalkalibacter urbisdiaboli]
MIYLDYSATTPMSDAALFAYQKAAKNYFGNSNSLHQIGQEAEHVLYLSRKSIASPLQIQPNELYFTGSGSEANFLALTSLASANKHKGNNIVTTRCEHHSVLQALHYLQSQGFTITYVPVNEQGLVTVEALEEAISENTILATFAHANSELGTVQDLVAIGQLLSNHKVLFHSDCVQTYGKLPIPVDVLTSLSISGHKIYGPKGIGATFIRSQYHWKSFLEGTTHEFGFRPGTVDVPSVVSFATAAEDIHTEREQEMKRLSLLRERVVKALCNNSSVVFEGHPTKRLPFHLGIRLKGIEGQLVMLECNRKGVAISTGSACRVGQSSPPQSLLAIGRTHEEAHEFIRVTFGKWTTEKDTDTLVECIQSIVSKFRKD